MSEVRIPAETRTEFGKGAARRVRRAAKVPAVLYGHGDAPRHLALPGHELMLALKSDANVLLTLQTEDGDQLALPRSVVRDPIRGHLEHLDLIAVRQGERVSVDVPVVLTGEAGPDVLIDQQSTTVHVTAEATHLPESIEVDIATLAVGQSITAADLTLPTGATLAVAPDSVLVQALAVPSAAQVEAELAEAEAEVGAGQAGAETVTEGAEAEASDVDAGGGTGDVVPDTDSGAGGPA